jgi:hypothetical protein
MTNEYLNSLTNKEKIGYDIAKNQLGTAFSLEKSLGYLHFLEKYSESKKTQTPESEKKN